jgi:hypothetical protein
MKIEEAQEIRECHPEGLVECYCDNTHQQNNTVCMYCLVHKRMALNIPPDGPVEPYEIFPGYLAENGPGTWPNQARGDKRVFACLQNHWPAKNLPLDAQPPESFRPVCGSRQSYVGLPR